MVGRPRVGVTGPARRLRIGWWATRFNLWLAGAEGCYLTAAKPSWRSSLRGVIIGGGDDIHPGEIGPEHDSKARYDPERDEMEIAIIKRALQAAIPLFGICRGSQLLNIVLGGTLHQDIRGMHQRVPFRKALHPAKTINVEPKSQLAEIMGLVEARVNSLHHQAIDCCGEGLRVVARDGNGIVQAIESTDREFVLGVQWHPEYLPYRREQRAIFKAFVGAINHCERDLPPTS